MNRCPNPACVLKVGDGRGFIIEHRTTHPRLGHELSKRRVVTAAHCLPKLPPAHPAAHWWERTFHILGSLDGRKHDVAVECLFVDPVADIAVLGRPDEPELGNEADAYDALTNDAPVLRIGKARDGPGWVLALDNHWVPTTLEIHGLWIPNLSIDLVEAGLSGSPILNDDGRAVGVVAVGSEIVSAGGTRKPERARGQPILLLSLPGWLLQKWLRVSLDRANHPRDALRSG